MSKIIYLDIILRYVTFDNRLLIGEQVIHIIAYDIIVEKNAKIITYLFIN
jgi:hypothetical protein